MHATEVECIAKEKAETSHVCGVKVSVAVTAKEGISIGMRSTLGALYGGLTVYGQAPL